MSKKRPTIRTLTEGNAVGKINVKYVSDTLKGVVGYDGKKWFITRWKKH